MSQRLKDGNYRLEKQVEEATVEVARSKADVAREAAARERVEQQAFLFQRAMDHSPNGVLIANMAASIEYVNSKFIEMTGYPRSDVVGKNAKSLGEPGDAKNPFDRIWETINSKGERRGETVNRRADGAEFWTDEAILPMTSPSGEVTHYLAVEQDITKTKQAEEMAEEANHGLADVNVTLEQRVAERTLELQQANERLIEAHEQLVRNEKLAAIGQLAAGMAHDLRNPLGAIRNAHFYLAGKLAGSAAATENPKIIEFLKIIDDEVGNSNKIVSDLMDFARIAPPNFSATDLCPVVEEAVNSLEVPGHIRLEVNLTEKVQVQADAQQLHRVLVNLSMNAIDAMADGGVLNISVRDCDGMAEIVVADNGEGIDEQTMKRIFDPLFTTKTKGTGLGLAVCQQIAARHGGVIEVSSTKGEGSTFTVRLPVFPDGRSEQEE